MHSLFEMAQVGKFSSYTVSVYGGEGNIPHFHFYTKDRSTSGCIRIDKAEYFVHGKCKDKLSAQDKRKFIEWITSTETPFKKYTDKLTVWEYIKILWNENNEVYKISDDIPMPDYSLLS